MPWTKNDSELARRLYERFLQERSFLSINEDHSVLAKKIEDDFLSEMSQVSAVSFDIFDTALLRSCLQPNHVFFFLKDREPFKSLSLSSEQIHIRRIRAEQDAREKLFQETQSIEVNLSEIYRQFCHVSDISADLAPQMVAAEQEIEFVLANPNPAVFRLYKQACEQNKTILFLSDTFFDRNFLYQLLIRSGYEVAPDQIFSSSDHRHGKYSGELIRIACKQSNIAPRQLLHIGDDKKSDGDGAVKANAKSLLHPFTPHRRYHIRAGSSFHQKIETLVHGIALAKSDGADFWFQLGQQAFGPLFAGFALWLIQQFRRDNIQKAVFMLRDGFILSEVYNLFRGDYPDLPSVELLCSSRRAFGIAALGCSNTIDTEFLIVSANPRPAKEFLTRFNLDAEKLSHVFRQAGFSSPDEIVDHRGSPAKVLSLLRHADVLAQLNQRALVERKLLIRYLEQQQILGDKKTALIDLGWNGTVQKSLVTILNFENIHHDLTGYYLGTFPRIQDPELSHYRYESYLCHEGEPHSIAASISSCRELFEIICTNFQGSLRHFTKSEGKISPVFDEVETTPEQLAIVKTIHDGILAYAKDFLSLSLAKNISFIPLELAAAPVTRIINHPTAREAQSIGSLQIGDGLGSLTRKPLAQFSSNSFDFLSLQSDYKNAYWKQGLLSQQSPQSFILKNFNSDQLLQLIK